MTIPIKRFMDKKYSLNKQAAYLSKDAEIVKHFKMPIIDLIKTKKTKKKK